MARWPSSRTLDLSFQGGRFKSCHGLSGSDLRQVVHTHEHSGCSGLVVLRARSRKVAGSQLSRAGLGGLLYSLPRGRLPVAHITATQMTQNVVSPRLQNIVATWTQNAPRVVHVIIRHLLGLRLLSPEEGRGRTPGGRRSGSDYDRGERNCRLQRHRERDFSHHRERNDCRKHH